MSAKLRVDIHQLIGNDSDRRDRLVLAVSDHLQSETTRSSIIGCIRYPWHRRNVSFVRPLQSVVPNLIQLLVFPLFRPVVSTVSLMRHLKVI